MWLIYSHEHDAWWAKHASGYTDSVAEAGRYMQRSAAEICKNAVFGGPVSCSHGIGFPPEIMIHEFAADKAAAIEYVTAQFIGGRVPEDYLDAMAAQTAVTEDGRRAGGSCPDGLCVSVVGGICRQSACTMTKQMVARVGRMARPRVDETIRKTHM
jgi:hypothetical protein